MKHMATLQKAIKVGSSVAAVLPKALLASSGIVAGAQITVEAVEGGILISPVLKQRRTRTKDERVAETALGLINRYQKAIKRLADA